MTQHTKVSSTRCTVLETVSVIWEYRQTQSVCEVFSATNFSFLIVNKVRELQLQLHAVGAVMLHFM
jgi:hypothetical protein